MRIEYHWSEFKNDKPPPDEALQACFAHGAPAEEALMTVAMLAWDQSSPPFLVSSPIPRRLPGGNYYEADLRWDLVGVRPSRWKALEVTISFVDPFTLTTSAPGRFDLFLAPSTSGRMEREVPDLGEQALRRQVELVERLRPALPPLLSLLYQGVVTDVDLTAPDWEEECVPMIGADAYHVEGVVRQHNPVQGSKLRLIQP